MENEKEFLEHQKLLENVHHPSGPIYSGISPTLSLALHIITRYMEFPWFRHK